MTRPNKLTSEQAGFLDDAGLQRIFDILEQAGGEVRVNGGAVRNALLGEPVHEVDLSTSLRPENVVEILQHAGVKVVPTGIDHGTVTAILEGVAYELTTLREDVETFGRHARVEFGTSWKADAERRDFTMNALYCDRKGKLYDPLDGYPDIEARRIRFIGDAETRISEDRLRILRFFRFFAWYGQNRPDAEGLKACVRMRDGLTQLSAERVWRELKRLLAAPEPRRALLWMRTSGILSVILPESDKWGIDLIPGFVDAEKRADETPDPLLRLMAMLPPRRERIDPIAERLRLSGEEHDRLLEWAATQERIAGTDADRLSQERLAEAVYRHGRQAVLDSLRLERANESTSPDCIAEAIRFAEHWPVPEFPVKGRDLIERGYSPGPEMGAILGRLEDSWVESGFQMAKSDLLEVARSMREK